MRRSAVHRGQFDQRDRAQLRGRLDARPQDAPMPARDELIAWLETSLNADDASEIERLNLDHFLRNTGQVDLSADERLRQLAIFLEPNLLIPQPRAWLALDRIYERAVRLAPKSLWLHHSRSLSAKSCAEGVSSPNEANTYRRIMTAAWDAANEACSLAPTDPDVLYLLGSLSYVDPDRTLVEALNFFDGAIQNDPSHQWSLLYRAHCLQDLEHWAGAATAYDSVAPAHFVGPQAWRYELLLEQKAYCVFRSGDRATALLLFQSLLNRWLADPGLGFGVMGVSLSEVAQGEFREELSSGYNELVRMKNWTWLGHV